MNENKLTNAQVMEQLIETMTVNEREALKGALKIVNHNPEQQTEQRKAIAHGILEVYQYATEETTKAGYRQLVKKYQNADRVKLSAEELAVVTKFYKFVTQE